MAPAAVKTSHKVLPAPTQKILNRHGTSDDLMIRTTIFGLLVLTIGLGTIFVLAETEMPSPLKQFQQGITIEEIQCRDARILMSSPSGRPACVYDISVSILEQRGFVKVVTTDRVESKTDGERTTFTYHNSKPGYGGHSSIGPTASIPIYTIEIPTNTIAVGEPCQCHTPYLGFIPTERW